MSFGCAGQLEEFGLVGQIGSRDVCLIMRYLRRELPLKDVVAIQRLLKTDLALAALARPLTEFWQSPRRRDVTQLLGLTRPYVEWNRGAFYPEKWSGKGEEDRDMRLLAGFLSGWLPQRYEQAVIRRLAADLHFADKAWPVAQVWKTVRVTLDRLVDEVKGAVNDEDDEDDEDTVDAPAVSADADETLIRTFLAMKLPMTEAGGVEERLRTDDAFALKVAPLLRTWRIPWRLS